MAKHAMILAAGRGERMRPLTDARPKPLLPVAGKPLIVWQIERLVAAGFTELTINVAHLGEQIEAALGDGTGFGASIRYSREQQPLEVGGGIATALPLLGDGVSVIVSSDIYHDYDFAALGPHVEAMMANREPPHVHMIMVPNPTYHPQGDFALRMGRLSLEGSPRYTFGNVAIYRTALFQELPRGVSLKITPLYRDWIARGWVSGELFTGRWANVGTPEELARLEALLRPASNGRPGP